MSLINSASEWNSVEKPRKRIPSMKKLLKNQKKKKMKKKNLRKKTCYHLLTK